MTFAGHRESVRLRIFAYVLSALFLVALSTIFAPPARALENCTCSLTDTWCRPVAHMSSDMQRTRLFVGWVYGRTHCHDFYIVRYGVIGRAPVQVDIDNAPFPCKPTNDFGGVNCGFGWAFNKDKPYKAVVNACTHSFFEGSSCTGWSEPAYWLPYGDDTCKDGFVWREAFNGDRACVTVASKNLAASENSTASTRTQGFGPSGQDTCKSPFVWREADRVGNAQGHDHVCVTGARRQAVALENAASAGNRAFP